MTNAMICMLERAVDESCEDNGNGPCAQDACDTVEADWEPAQRSRQSSISSEAWRADSTLVTAAYFLLQGHGEKMY